MMQTDMAQAVNVYEGEWIRDAEGYVAVVTSVTLGHGELTFHFSTGHDVTHQAGDAIEVFSD
jgi:hypothetical protein